MKTFPALLVLLTAVVGSTAVAMPNYRGTSCLSLILQGFFMPRTAR